ILQRGAKEPERLTQTELAEQDVEFSPDGGRIAYVADPDRPFVFNVQGMDLASRSVRTLTHEPVNVYHPVWTQDAKFLAATVTPDDQKGELLLIDVESATVKRIAPPVKDGIAWPVRFLSDGALLTLALNPAGFQQLCLVDVATGVSRFVGPGEWDVEAAA